MFHKPQKTMGWRLEQLVSTGVYDVLWCFTHSVQLYLYRLHGDFIPSPNLHISTAENQPSGHRRVGVRKAGRDRGALLGQRGTGVDRQQLEVSEPPNDRRLLEAWKVLTLENRLWLVVSTPPLWKIWKSVGMIIPYIWVNYNNSLTWIKAIWGWFPLLTMIPVRSL